MNFFYMNYKKTRVMQEKNVWDMNNIPYRPYNLSINRINLETNGFN